jgi:hypothetical protein
LRADILIKPTDCDWSEDKRIMVLWNEADLNALDIVHLLAQPKKRRKRKWPISLVRLGIAKKLHSRN